MSEKFGYSQAIRTWLQQPARNLWPQLVAAATYHGGQAFIMLGQAVPSLSSYSGLMLPLRLDYAKIYQYIFVFLMYWCTQ